MIHISNNMYLSQQAAFGKPVIGYKTILNFSNVAATSTVSGSSVVNLVNNNTYQYWVSASISEQYITVTNTGDEDVDYGAIARHNFGTAQITYQFQGSDNGSDWTNLTTEKIPEDDRAILEYFDNTNYNFYRLRMVPDGLAPRIAHMKIGELLIMPRCIRAPHSPITLSRETKVITNVSENGNFLGRTQVNQFLTSQYEFQNIVRSIYETDIEPFSLHAILGTFFIAWKPIAYPLDVAYAWVQDGQDISFRYDNDSGLGSFGFTAKAVA